MKHRAVSQIERLGRYVALAFITGTALLAALLLYKRADTRPEFVLFFDEPINGLSTGAPVKSNGVIVGRVEHCGLRYFENAAGNSAGRKKTTPAIAAEVVVTFDAAEVSRLGSAFDPADPTALQREIKRGLRGKLAILSPASGTAYIELVRLPDSPALLRLTDSAIREIPVLQKSTIASKSTGTTASTTGTDSSDDDTETYADKLLAFSQRDFAALERDWNSKLDAVLAAAAPERLRSINDKTLAGIGHAKALISSASTGISTASSALAGTSSALASASTALASDSSIQSLPPSLQTIRITGESLRALTAQITALSGTLAPLSPELITFRDSLAALAADAASIRTAATRAASPRAASTSSATRADSATTPPAPKHSAPK